jgi:hypothetical protein
MKKKTKIIVMAALITGSCIVSWFAMYFNHFTHLSSYKTFDAPMALSQINPSYEQYIEPVISQKCSACHTDTLDRPFFYYLPLIKHWSIPYVDSDLEKARGQFEITEGLATERLGSTMERLRSLRQVFMEESMPPMIYHNLRPYQKINSEEKEMILSWTEQALAALNQATFKNTLADQHLTRLSKEAFGERLAKSLLDASPIVDNDDAQSHAKAVANLGEDEFLRTRMNNPFLWGGQNKEDSYNTADQHLNRFNTLVWRKLYLSLFMFDGRYETIQLDEAVAYIFPIKFRGDLADGAYPYPFWHSANKWSAYNESKNLIFLMKDNKIIVAMRSAAKKDVLPDYDDRVWGEVFRWFDGEDYQPKVNNYASVFSAGNPHVERLDAAYRRLALGFRSENCTVCHSPANHAKMKMLEFLSSPAHTLAAKDRLPIMLLDNEMPPVEGVSNHETKSTMVELSIEFQKVADLALAYEDESAVDNMARAVVNGDE